MSEEIAVQESLFAESNRMEIVEAYKGTHKTAFRVAFNFLDAHFPPVNTEDWWRQTCEDALYVEVQHDGNQLCKELLGEVISYLSEFAKKSEEK